MCIKVRASKQKTGKPVECKPRFRCSRNWTRQSLLYTSAMAILVFWVVFSPESSQPTYLASWGSQSSQGSVHRDFESIQPYADVEKIDVSERGKQELAQAEVVQRISWFGTLNPSIVIYGSSIYVLLRRNLYTDRSNKKGYKGQDHQAAMILKQYDSNWNLIASKEVDFEANQIANDPLCLTRWSTGIEDGRMFVFNDNLYTLGAICHAVDHTKARIDQYLISLSFNISELNTYRKSVNLILPDKDTAPVDESSYKDHSGWLMEKNWLPFEQNGVLYVVYSAAPHFCVKRLEIAEQQLADAKCYTMPNDAGYTLRGSAGVIDLPYKGKTYKAVLSHWRRSNVYMQYLILFDPYSFRPITASQGFTFDCMNDWAVSTKSLKDCGIVFVTSMNRLNDKEIMFGFGWQDRVAVVATMQQDTLLQLLHKSSGPMGGWGSEKAAVKSDKARAHIKKVWSPKKSLGSFSRIWKNPDNFVKQEKFPD